MPTHLIRGSFAVASLALAVAALAGCSSSGSDAPPDAVAHLPSTRATTGNSGTHAGTESSSATTRPRSKLFETEQEQQADLVPYNNCMRAHHVQVSPQGKPTNEAQFNLYVAADHACADKKPLPPLENDPANPKALAFNRAVVACLHAHGVTDVTIETDNGYMGVAFGGNSVALGMKYADTCTHQAANRHH